MGEGSARSPLLRFLWLEITPTCNLKCHHCYTQSGPDVRAPDLVDWVGLLHQAHALGCRQVQFIGGEPTSHPGLSGMLDAAHELGFELVEVYTNLVSVAPRMLAQWARQGVAVATSFYSARAPVHDLITASPGSFQRTVRNIKAVIAAGIPLRIGGTELPENANERDEAVAFLVSLGVDPKQITYDHVRAVGRGGALEGAHGAKASDPGAALCGNCWRGSLAVSWDGACRPCVMSRHICIGKVPAMTLDAVVRSRALEDFRQRHFMRTQVSSRLPSTQTMSEAFRMLLATPPMA